MTGVYFHKWLGFIFINDWGLFSLMTGVISLMTVVIFIYDWDFFLLMTEVHFSNDRGFSLKWPEFLLDLSYLIMIADIYLSQRFIPLLTVRDTNRALNNQLTNQSINQPTNQSVNQSINVIKTSKQWSITNLNYLLFQIKEWKTSLNT